MVLSLPIGLGLVVLVWFQLVPQTPLIVLLLFFLAFFIERVFEKLFALSGWETAELILQRISKMRKAAPELGFDYGRQEMRLAGNREAWNTTLSSLGVGPCSQQSRDAVARMLMCYFVASLLLPPASAIGWFASAGSPVQDRLLMAFLTLTGLPFYGLLFTFVVAGPLLRRYL